jgi:hypothetical protein
MIDWAAVVQAASAVDRASTLASNSSGAKLDRRELAAFTREHAKLANSFIETRCAVRRRQWGKATDKAKRVLEHSANLRALAAGIGFDTTPLDSARARLQSAILA